MVKAKSKMPNNLAQLGPPAQLSVSIVVINVFLKLAIVGACFGPTGLLFAKNDLNSSIFIRCLGALKSSCGKKADLGASNGVVESTQENS